MAVVDDQMVRGDRSPRHASPSTVRFHVVEYSVPRLDVPELSRWRDADIDPEFHADLMEALARFRAALGSRPRVADAGDGFRGATHADDSAEGVPMRSHAGGPVPHPRPIARPRRPVPVGEGAGIPSPPDLGLYRAPDDVDALFSDPSFDESSVSDQCRAAIDGISVRVVPFDSLMSFALLNRQSLGGPDRHLDLGFYMRDPVRQTAIYAVNYIRHRLTGRYGSVVAEMPWSDYRVYKYALLHAIAQAYPRLASECARQASLIDERGGSGRIEDAAEPVGCAVPPDGGGRDDEPVEPHRVRAGGRHGHRGGRAAARGARSGRRR